MKKLTLWLLSVLALIAAGCGGGGGSSGGAASGNVGLFVTDDLHNGWQAVWVTIYRVELTRQGGGTAVVFDDSAGKVINLRALNDGNPRYAFLGKDRVPEGIYTGIRFTMDKDVRISPNGSNDNLPRVFDDSLLNPSNPEQAILNLSFGSPKTMTAASAEIVADFVLASWTENGTKIQNALVSEGNGNGLDDGNRHEDDDFHGTISNLSGTAPDFTFTMNLRSGNTLNVSTNSLTAVFNSNGAPNPALANGKRIEVRGTFSPATQSLLATSIKIEDQEDEDEDQVKGAVSNLNEGQGTFDVAATRVRGFVPTETIVHVATATTTRFFSHGGVLITQAQFFAALALPNARAEVEGTWNEATNTLTARKAKIEDEDEDHEAEGKGSPNTIDAGAGTFRIQLTEWEGFSATPGTQLNVVTTGSTRFRNEDTEVTKEQFFTLLSTASTVKVEGIYENGTLTAKEARIRTGSSGGGGQAEARGGATAINSGARTFGIVLTGWDGFSGTAGSTVNIQMANGATFRGLNGESLTADQFFAQLSNGQLVEAEGSYSSGTNTLTATKAKLED